MEVTCSSESSVDFQHTIRGYIPQDWSHRCENLKSIFFSVVTEKNENLLGCTVQRKIISHSFGIPALPQKGTRQLATLWTILCLLTRFHSSYLWTRRCNSAAAVKCSQFLVPEWESQEVGTHKNTQTYKSRPSAGATLKRVINDKRKLPRCNRTGLLYSSLDRPKWSPSRFGWLCQSVLLVSFKVSTAMAMKLIVLWDMRPRSLVNVCLCFRGTWRLHLRTKHR
jgi:hypothetical protein